MSALWAAPFAALTLVLSASGPALAQPTTDDYREPVYLRDAATLASPYPVRWLVAGGEALLVSDVATGVAAIRGDSGVIAWRREPRAPLTGVWAAGDVVVAVSDTIDVFQRSIATRVCDRSLRCGADGVCAARVLGLVDGGLLVSEGGRIQERMTRLDLRTCQAAWAQPAEVFHPREVLAVGGTVFAQDGNAPWALRALNAETGGLRGAWVRDTGGQTRGRPATDRLALADGRVLALDRRPTDGSLGHVWVVDARGEVVGRRTLERPEGVVRAAVWARVVEDRLVLWLPREAGGGEALSWPIPSAAAGAGGKVVRMTLGGSTPPTVVGSTLFTTESTGGALALHGVDARTGATVAQVPMTGVSAAAGASLWALGGDAASGPSLVLAIGRQEPAPMWVVDTRGAWLSAYGQLDGDGAAVGAVAGTPEGLWVATGTAVHRFEPAAMTLVSEVFESLTSQGRAAEARSLVERLAPLAASSVTVRRMRATVAALGMEEVAREAEAGRLEAALRIASEVTSASQGDVDGMVAMMAPVARAIGPALARSRRLSAAEREQLLRLGAALASGLAQHRDALAPGGKLGFQRDGVVRAAVVVATALLAADAPDEAADVLMPVATAKRAEVDVVSLYEHAALSALVGLHEATRSGLRGRDAAKQRAALALVGRFRHGAAALGDAKILPRAVALADGDDPVQAAAAAADIEHLLRMRAGEVRRSRTPEAACALSCRAFTAVCADSCALREDALGGERGQAACDTAGERCQTGCERGRLDVRPLGTTADRCR